MTNCLCTHLSIILVFISRVDCINCWSLKDIYMLDTLSLNQVSAIHLKITILLDEIYE